MDQRISQSPRNIEPQQAAVTETWEGLKRGCRRRSKGSSRRFIMP